MRFVHPDGTTASEEMGPSLVAPDEMAEECDRLTLENASLRIELLTIANARLSNALAESVASRDALAEESRRCAETVTRLLAERARMLANNDWIMARSLELEEHAREILRIGGELFLPAVGAEP